MTNQNNAFKPPEREKAKFRSPDKTRAMATLMVECKYTLEEAYMIVEGKFSPTTAGEPFSEAANLLLSNLQKMKASA